MKKLLSLLFIFVLCLFFVGCNEPNVPDDPNNPVEPGNPSNPNDPNKDDPNKEDPEKPVLLNEKIVIFHTDDMNGVLEETNTSIGISKIATLKKETMNSLLLDSGDATYGSMLSYLSNGKDVIELMNIAGYDAMALGDLDFSNGYLALTENVSSANFPIISGNTYFQGKRLLENDNYNGSYIIKEIGKAKLGIIAITTSESKYSNNPKEISAITFNDEIEEAKKAINEIKDNVDAIVILSHIGNENNMSITVNQFCDSIQTIKDNKVVAIIDGNSDIANSKMNDNTLICQTGSNLENIGKLTITFTDGVVSLTDELLDKSSFKDIKSDQVIDEKIDNIKNSYEEILSKEIIDIPFTLWGGSLNDKYIAQIAETNLGDLICDSILAKASEILDYIPNKYRDLPLISLKYGSNIKNGISMGKVSYDHLFSLYDDLDLNNNIVLKKINSKYLFDLLEKSVSNIVGVNGNNTLEGSYFEGYLQIGGFKFIYNPNNPVGEKVTKVILDNGKQLSKKEEAELLLCAEEGLCEGDFVAVVGNEIETITKYFKYISENKEILSKYEYSQKRIIPENIEEYYATFFIEKSKNSTLEVVVDGKDILKIKVDRDGYLKVKLSDGMHILTISDYVCYVNNHTGHCVSDDLILSLDITTAPDPIPVGLSSDSLSIGNTVYVYSIEDDDLILDYDVQLSSDIAYLYGYTIYPMAEGTLEVVISKDEDTYVFPLTITNVENDSKLFNKVINNGEIGNAYLGNLGESKYANPYTYIQMAKDNGLDTNKSLLTISEIKEILESSNKANIRCYDLTSYMGMTTYENVKKMFTSLDKSGKKYGYSSYYVSGSGDLEVRYAVCTEFTRVYSAPLNSSLTTKNSYETALEVNEPVIVFCENGDFSLILAQNYLGWTKTSNLGFCDENEFLEVINNKEFVLITSERITKNEIKDLPISFIRMGSKLKIKNITKDYVTVLFPIRNSDGNLKYQEINLSSDLIKNESIHLGYLPYNIRNIIIQGMKPLGMEYAWGDCTYKDSYGNVPTGNRDCSGLLGSVYKCFGLIIPRNTTQEAAMDSSITYTKSFNYTGATNANLIKVMPGALILKSGHVMMYLGHSGYNCYMVHSNGKANGVSVDNVNVYGVAYQKIVYFEK